ncbi:MAG: replication-relaxation family protein [Actinobacteria bacterium]|nr:replication-relaxation family protein [Actinomycetota bacterium]
MSGQRVSRRRLEDIRASLADRDLQILVSLATHRFLTTRQICRLHFGDKPTETAALRSANRALYKLRSLRLLVALERRIGGVRAGSGSYVWSLGHIGARLLQRANDVDGLPRRQRQREPSTTFLEHTLAVAEVSLRLREIANRGEVTLLGVQHEPACWRPYSGPGGGTVRLKPDLAAVTATEKFEDHWFFEVDLATEPPSRVVRACQNYQAYRQSGVEQRRLGLFPAVVWIVPTGRRKETLVSHLDGHDAISARLFTVITLDELEGLLRRGAPFVTTARAEAESNRAE